MSIASGDIIAKRYVLQTLLHRSHAGVTFLAGDRRGDEAITVRFLPGFAGPLKRRAARALTSQLTALSRLQHPLLAPVYAHGVHEGIPFLVSAPPSGVPLAAEIELAPLALERVVHIGHEIALLLTFLHEHDIIHSDLRPETAALDPTMGLPRVRLTGFGPAAARDLSGWDSDQLAYLAPEQIGGQAADVGSDLFGLGAILHALINGSPPPYPPAPQDGDQTPAWQNPHAPASLSLLVGALCSQQREARPASAAFVASQLRHIGQNDLVDRSGEPQPGDQGPPDPPD